MVRMIRPLRCASPAATPPALPDGPGPALATTRRSTGMAWTPPPTEPITNLDQISRPRLQCCSRRRLTATRRQAVRALRRSLMRRGNARSCDERAWRVRILIHSPVCRQCRRRSIHSLSFVSGAPNPDSVLLSGCDRARRLGSAGDAARQPAIALRQSCCLMRHGQTSWIAGTRKACAELLRRAATAAGRSGLGLREVPAWLVRWHAGAWGIIGRRANASAYFAVCGDGGCRLGGGSSVCVFLKGMIFRLCHV